MKARTRGSEQATAELAAHLKATAHEALAAAHAALDLVEGLVDDPSPVTRVVDSLLGTFVARGRQAAGADETPGGAERGRVEHIRVS